MAINYLTVRAGYTQAQTTPDTAAQFQATKDLLQDVANGSTMRVLRNGITAGFLAWSGDAASNNYKDLANADNSRIIGLFGQDLYSANPLFKNAVLTYFTSTAALFAGWVKKSAASAQAFGEMQGNLVFTGVVASNKWCHLGDQDLETVRLEVIARCLVPVPNPAPYQTVMINEGRRFLFGLIQALYQGYGNDGTYKGSHIEHTRLGMRAGGALKNMTNTFVARWRHRMAADPGAFTAFTSNTKLASGVNVMIYVNLDELPNLSPFPHPLNFTAAEILETKEQIKAMRSNCLYFNGRDRLTQADLDAKRFAWEQFCIYLTGESPEQPRDYSKLATFLTADQIKIVAKAKGANFGSIVGMTDPLKGFIFALNHRPDEVVQAMTDGSINFYF